MKIYNWKRFSFGIALSIVFIIIGWYSSADELTSSQQFENDIALKLKAATQVSDIEVSKDLLKSLPNTKIASFGKYKIQTYVLEGKRHAVIWQNQMSEKLGLEVRSFARSKYPQLDKVISDYETSKSGEKVGEYVLIVQTSRFTILGLGMLIFLSSVFVLNFFGKNIAAKTNVTPQEKERRNYYGIFEKIADFFDDYEGFNKICMFDGLPNTVPADLRCIILIIMTTLL